MGSIRSYPEKRDGSVGGTLFYTLRADQYPTRPDKVWSGRIEKILIDINGRSQLRYYLVTTLGADHEGEAELVYPEQVVSFS